ncbi:hypothetical protein [Nodosilinea sp. P-1105]|uniref:hypothetical protein n=1 Tax=Nodosilinea sp. P-1105 TaxID=2546229 RepID=UPI00146C2912|nr:hypothetical protein [Nodosilinea sp. P-1105]NMF86326.1 hypothetical protein [Nodosilinea sp. P-1105]
MKLSADDAALFFELMWSLQIYVNQQLKLVHHIDDPADYEQRPLEEKMKVRQALYAQPELMQQFIDQNPRSFDQKRLDIVRQWTHFVAGDFYIERFLKKYTIFIGSDDVVYGVLGLWEGLNEMIHKSRLPLLVKTVLLPFQGQIVHDGLLQGTSIYFGGGIKGNLKEIYMAAKNAGQIVESIGSDRSLTSPTKTAIQPAKDWRPLLADLAEQAKVLRGGNGQPPINSPAFSLVKASLELAQLAVQDPDNTDQMLKSLDKVERSCQKAEKTLLGYRRW